MTAEKPASEALLPRLDSNLVPYHCFPSNDVPEAKYSGSKASPDKCIVVVFTAWVRVHRWLCVSRKLSHPRFELSHKDRIRRLKLLFIGDVQVVGELPCLLAAVTPVLRLLQFRSMNEVAEGNRRFQVAAIGNTVVSNRPRITDEVGNEQIKNN